MGKKKPPRGKRRTREHVIADLAVNHVERQALLCGCTVERIRYDYGTDLMVFTFTAAGEIEEGYLPIQVKATESLSLVEDGKAVAFRIARRDLVGWLRQSTPVFLAVYDAVAERAYWLHIQGYFRALAGFNLFAAPETITLRIPVGNVLDPDAIRAFAALRDAALRPPT